MVGFDLERLPHNMTIIIRMNGSFGLNGANYKRNEATNEVTTHCLTP